MNEWLVFEPWHVLRLWGLILLLIERQNKDSNLINYLESQFFFSIIGILNFYLILTQLLYSNIFRVWEYNGYSSKGLAQVAKWGSTRILESELKAESKHIRTIVKARGLWYPNVNGKTFAVFRTDSKHHLVSLVSTEYEKLLSS